MLIANLPDDCLEGTHSMITWKLDEYGDGYQAGTATSNGTGNGRIYVVGSKPEEDHVLIGPWRSCFDSCVLPVAVAAGYTDGRLAITTRLLQC